MLQAHPSRQRVDIRRRRGDQLGITAGAMNAQNVARQGEVVGGIFGRDRLGGTMLTNCLVMGRVAGLGTTTNPYPKS